MSFLQSFSAPVGSTSSYSGLYFNECDSLNACLASLSKRTKSLAPDDHRYVAMKREMPSHLNHDEYQKLHLAIARKCAI